MEIWESGTSGTQSLLTDSARSFEALRSSHAPDGLMTHLTGDWMTAKLKPERLPSLPPPLPEQAVLAVLITSLLRVLKTGGLLRLENSNAIGMRSELKEWVKVFGYASLAASESRNAACKNVSAEWPSG